MGKKKAKNGNRRGNLGDTDVFCSCEWLDVVSGCLLVNVPVAEHFRDPRSLPGAWVFHQPLCQCETTNQELSLWSCWHVNLDSNQTEWKWNSLLGQHFKQADPLHECFQEQKPSCMPRPSPGVVFYPGCSVLDLAWCREERGRKHQFLLSISQVHFLSRTWHQRCSSVKEISVPEAALCFLYSECSSLLCPKAPD